MNELVRAYYRGGNEEFREVVFLHEGDAAAPDLPLGWRQLAQVQGRVGLVRDFWLAKLPFHPKATPRIEAFFAQLDDVVPVVCRGVDEIWSELVYSMADGSTFFRGLAPQVDSLPMQEMYPRDFVSFLSIHNGFGRLSEVGLIRGEDLLDRRAELIEEFVQSESPVKWKGKILDPSALYPFYESLGVLQCFYGPVGNLDICALDGKMSELEHAVFPTFIEWLAAFLEGDE